MPPVVRNARKGSRSPSPLIKVDAKGVSTLALPSPHANITDIDTRKFDFNLHARDDPAINYNFGNAHKVNKIKGTFNIKNDVDLLQQFFSYRSRVTDVNMDELLEKQNYVTSMLL